MTGDEFAMAKTLTDDKHVNDLISKANFVNVASDEDDAALFTVPIPLFS